MDNLRLKTGGKVILESLPSEKNIVECTSIEISGGALSQEMFRTFVGRRSILEKILLNSNAYVTLDNGIRCMVKLHPEDCNYAFFDERDVRRVDVGVQQGVSVGEPKDEQVEDEEKSVAKEYDSFFNDFGIQKINNL